jgi:hypothetical protein
VTCGSKVLIFLSDLTALRNAEHGIEVHPKCACREPAVVLTEKRAGNTACCGLLASTGSAFADRGFVVVLQQLSRSDRSMRMTVLAKSAYLSQNASPAWSAGWSATAFSSVRPATTTATRSAWRSPTPSASGTPRRAPRSAGCEKWAWTTSTPGAESSASPA